MQRNGRLGAIVPILIVGAAGCNSDGSHVVNPSSTPTVTHTLIIGESPGVVASPLAGAHTHESGSRVSYEFHLKPGFENLRVFLDTVLVPPSGTMVVDSDRVLIGSADTVIVRSALDVALTQAMRSILEGPPMSAFRALEAAIESLDNSVGPVAAERRLRIAEAFAFDPAKDAAQLNRALREIGDSLSAEAAISPMAISAVSTKQPGTVVAPVAWPAQGETPILYVNGIATDLLTFSRTYRKFLPLIVAGARLPISSTYTVSGYYNPSAKYIDAVYTDFWTCVSLAANRYSLSLNSSLLPTAFACLDLSRGKGFPLADDLEQSFIQVANILWGPPGERAQPFARALADRMAEAIVAKGRVVVVAHSQGNLMVTEALALRSGGSSLVDGRCVGVVSVAPPIPVSLTLSVPSVSGLIIEDGRAKDFLLLVPSLVSRNGATRRVVNELSDAFNKYGFVDLPLVPKTKAWTFIESVWRGVQLHSINDSYFAYSRTIQEVQAALRAQVDTLDRRCPFARGVAPDAPSDLTASAQSGSQVNLSWADNSPNEDGFRVQRAASISSNFSLIATLGPNATKYEDVALAAASTYSYRLHAFNAAGQSPASNIVSVTTLPGVGDGIVFARAETLEPGVFGRFDLFSIGPDGSNLRRLTNTPDPNDENEMDPAWSPDGAWIATSGSPFDIWVLDANDGNRRNVTNDARAFSSHPTWSADQNSIAYSRYDLGTQQRDISAVNVSTGARRNLTNDSSDELSPAWAPSGSTIAFARQAGTPLSVWLMNADGSNQRKIADSAWDPAWSRDGSKLAVARADGIWVMNPDGSGMRNVTPGLVGAAASPSWDLSGANLVFSVPTGTQAGLWTTATDGTQRRRLTSREGDFQPDWRKLGGVPQFSLTIDGAGSGNGTVASDVDGINCIINAGITSGRCAATFNAGTAVSLSATPSSGSFFAGWEGACSGAGACQVVMAQSRAITADFTVPAPVPVASVTVSLANTTITVGRSTQASATLRDVNGNVLTGRPVTWSSSNTSVATVSQSGLVAGTAIGGPVSIIATSEGKSGSAQISVTATLAGAFAKIATGNTHTCALAPAGKAYCWGWNGGGEIGDGTFQARLVPRPVSSPNLFKAIVATESPPGFGGGIHTCAITLQGAALCWGANSRGDLGDGTNASDPRTTPVPVATSVQFASLTAGNPHTCGLDGQGQAFCWGVNNPYGQLGDGSMSDRPFPVVVATSLRFVILVARGWTTCGLTSQGSVYCWGYNAGHFGDGTTQSRTSPGTAVIAEPFSTMALGDGHGCGLTPQGQAYCWGQNGKGQVGDGTTTDRPTPVPAAGTLRFVSIVAGNLHTCGLTTDGDAFCWGFNSFGQHGDGTQSQTRVIPSLVSGGHRFAQLAAGTNYTCGVTVEGRAYCWGWNGHGQLGDGTTSFSRDVPTEVASPVAIQSATGTIHK